MANGSAQGLPENPAGADGPALNATSARVSSADRNRLGIYFVCLTLVTFYVLIATWPVVDNDPNNFADARVFGLKLRDSPDARLFAAGAVGSLVHCLPSFAD
jgi:hypothetical protein